MYTVRTFTVTDDATVLLTSRELCTVCNSVPRHIQRNPPTLLHITVYRYCWLLAEKCCSHARPGRQAEQAYIPLICMIIKL